MVFIRWSVVVIVVHFPVAIIRITPFEHINLITIYFYGYFDLIQRFIIQLASKWLIVFLLVCTLALVLDILALRDIWVRGCSHSTFRHDHHRNRPISTWP